MHKQAWIVTFVLVTISFSAKSTMEFGLLLVLSSLGFVADMMCSRSNAAFLIECVMFVAVYVTLLSQWIPGG
jgi:hypothetical protein